MNTQAHSTGRLTCVGTGMTMASHLTPLSKSYIEQADVVYSLMSHGAVHAWLQTMNPNIVSLQQYYQEGRNRKDSYRDMVEAMLTSVREGKNVVGAFYGHPGVFAYVPHKAIEIAKSEGYQAHMEPGISAEDCLVADLGIDPGKYGCIQFETTQLMHYQRQLDPTAYLILWQIGIAGDLSLSQFSTNQKRLSLLVELLSEHYPEDHPVILYEARTLPIGEPRINTVLLRDLPNAELSMHTTAVLKPSKKLQTNPAMTDRLQQLNL